MAETRTTDVVVIGGGLSGLTAAAFLAQAGRKVLLFEKTHTLGGRAVTQTKNGFSFNLGPHALYQGGPGIAVLRELNVPFTGSAPSGAGAYAVDQGVLHTFPAGFVSLLTTGLLRWQAKVELARMLGSFHKLQPGSLQHVTVQEWLNRTVRNLKVRQVLQAFFRVTSYANAPDEYSAGTAIAQAQAALSKNVLYLDGGWQTLVDGLRRVGERAGVVMEAEQRITSVEYDTVVQGVRLANSSFIPASAVVITGSPEEAVALLPKDQTPLHAWVKTVIPINPATATDAKTDEQELEQLLDLMQPGWRNVAVERRFLPHMTVYHALPTARMKGLAGRPGPAVSGVDNLYIAGDWVGAEGMLADASLASAKRAATLILQRGGTLMEQAA
jgi:phytoene dehydrogenase-like protein